MRCNKINPRKGVIKHSESQPSSSAIFKALEFPANCSLYHCTGLDYKLIPRRICACNFRWNDYRIKIGNIYFLQFFGIQCCELLPLSEAFIPSHLSKLWSTCKACLAGWNVCESPQQIFCEPHSQIAGIVGICFFGEPDSKNAGSSRFACETHGQNAGLIRFFYDMHGQNAGISRVNTVKMLELWGFVMTCTVKMPEFLGFCCEPDIDNAAIRNDHKHPIPIAHSEPYSTITLWNPPIAPVTAFRY